MNDDEVSRVAERLRACAPGTVWLDAARSTAGTARSLLFSDPVQLLTAERIADVPLLMGAVDEALDAGYHVAGYLSYEAGYAFEEVGEFSVSGQPLGWFGVYEPPCVVHGGAAEEAVELAGEAQYELRGPAFGLSRSVYRARLEEVAAAIYEGDIYQANFTDRISFSFAGSPLALYRALRRRQRVPYGAFLNDGHRHILCLSPELFVRREGRHVMTRPMKGTAPRGRTLGEDQARQTWLAGDPKSQAENLMIVDLLRNDLARCCRAGTVQVPALFETERYETVIQMTSTITGELRDGAGYADLFRALFPCGSVTGAPKIRAMELIEHLERSPRGIYCGTIGYASPDQRAVFNVAIRTVVIEEGQGHMGTGSGVVADSDADAEYDECMLKAQFLSGKGTVHEPFQLIETMRSEDGRIELLDLHLERLASSARYFDYVLEEGDVRARVQDCTARLPATPHKVRLTLARSGHVQVTSTPLGQWADEPVRLVLAADPVDVDDVVFYHKTTLRHFHEAAYARGRRAGYDEVVLCNGQGVVTEGSRTNLFVRDGDVFATPPVTSGLLGGVYRRHLLETLPVVEERVLHPRDLEEADELFVCNAVRGLVRARLDDPCATV